MVPLPFEDMPFTGATTVALGGLLIACYAFGRSIAFRRAYTAELESRAARLEQAREADVRAVVAEERTRIARELHDVVAHHVSVMTVQAAAARRTLSRDPERAAEALAAIETIGRGALDEMRRIISVLRDFDETGAGALAPQPGLDDIEELVEHLRGAGLDVTLTVTGERRELSPGIGLTVYRLVQEALTNTIKHGGPATATSRSPTRGRRGDLRRRLRARSIGRIGSCRWPTPRARVAGHAGARRAVRR